MSSSTRQSCSGRGAGYSGSHYASCGAEGPQGGCSQAFRNRHGRLEHKRLQGPHIGTRATPRRVRRYDDGEPDLRMIWSS